MGPWLGDKRPAAQQAAPEAKPRKLRRQGTAEVAAKAVKDNCKHMSEEDTYVRKVDGKTLYEKLCEDIRDKRNGAQIVMGAKYYRALKDAYRPASSPESRLKTPVPPETVSAPPIKAAIASKKGRPDHSLMQAYIGSAPMPNKTELVGILKWALGLRPTAEKELGPCLDMCRFAVRIKMQKSWPEEFDIMQSWFDTVLVEAYTRAKAQKVTPETFASLHSKLCNLVLDGSDLTAVAAATPRWGTVVTQLHRVVASSRIGSMLYSFALLNEICNQVSRTIDKAIAKVAKKPLTTESLNEFKFTCLEVVGALPNIDLLPVKRRVEVKYRGAPVVGDVTSLPAEISFRFAAVWKARAVCEKKLSPLWCEDFLNLDTAADAKFKDLVSDDDACKAAEVARAACKVAFDESGTGPSDAVMRTLKAKRSHWLLMDPDFGLEIAMIETLCGEGSEARLAASILDLFPTATKVVTLEEVCQQLHAMPALTIYKMASRAAQAKHSLVCTMLGRLCEGHAPCLATMSQDPTLAPVVARLGFFVRVTESSGSKGKSNELVGAAALKHLFEAARIKHGDTKATLNDVEKLRSFSFLVPADIKDACAQLVHEVEADNCSNLSQRASSQDTKKATKEKQATAVAEAMAMFS